MVKLCYSQVLGTKDLLRYIHNSLYLYNEFVITTAANLLYTCFLSSDYNFAN